MKVLGISGSPRKDDVSDAYVIGSPNYYSTINASTHALLERWFQFRHQEGNTLWGKTGSGGRGGWYSRGFPSG